MTKSTDKMIVEFSGWCSIDPKDLQLIKIGSEVSSGTFDKISGEKWLTLSPKDREHYIIEDLMATIRDCEDVEYIEIDFYKNEMKI